MFDALTAIRQKLALHPGELDAEQVIDEALRRARLVRKSGYAPDELMQLANGLIAAGGFIEMVGRSLKVTALLDGAKNR
jgi:hypothetical protein